MKALSLSILILLAGLLAGVCIVAGMPWEKLPANPAQGRTIELILDASGSMNAAMAAGGSKISAARAAVEKLAHSLPAGTRLAFRAYGHQSDRAKHDCADTQLLAPFGGIDEIRASLLEHLKNLRPRGYTPITRVLQMAAADFPNQPAGERIIVLVSDGQETCDGDPCAAAQALRAAAAALVIHTVGFGVDETARLQLQCIARATGGSYFDAADADQLAQVLGQAAVAPAGKMAAADQGPGKLQIKGADLMGHKVVDAVSGKQVGTVSNTHSIIDLPAGIYNVTFGSDRGKEEAAQIWKSVRVEAGKTTLLEPGILKVESAALAGHAISDSETGAVVNQVSATRDRATLLPGTYDVSFGKIVWLNVRVQGGQVTSLQPGTVTVRGANIQGHRILTVDGQFVGTVSATSSSMPLPPGSYSVEIGGRQVLFLIAEGKAVEVDARARK